MNINLNRETIRRIRRRQKRFNGRAKSVENERRQAHGGRKDGDKR